MPSAVESRARISLLASLPAPADVLVAAGATVASQDVNFTLVPEVPFKLDGERGFLRALKQRILDRAHAVVVVAEGAGQDLLGASGEERDASSNVKLKDIGAFLRDRIEAYCKAEKLPVVMRHFDPSYIIRSSPANAEDSILCDLFARNAAHAAMAGKTGLVIGFLYEKFIHVPIEMLTSRRKSMDPETSDWSAVLAAAGQPERFE
jgi:6-phosphofructokinase 1